MQSFSTFLSDNKGWAALAALLATVVLILIVLFLYRLAFGRRLRMAGGRTRQPRLGVVDAFDLDRQRQLVLIRRDNVEHLVMIGGPNDLVIESAFIRAQPSVALPVGRDKEGSLPPAALIPMATPLPSVTASVSEPRPAAVPIIAAEAPQAPLPAPQAPPSASQTPPPVPPALDLTHPVSPKDLGPLADLPAPAPVAAPPSKPAPAPSPPAVQDNHAAAPPHPLLPQEAGPTPLPALPPLPPTQRAPFSRLAQGLQPRPPGSVLPPRPPLSSMRTPAATTAQAATPRPVGPPPANRPTPPAPLQRGNAAVSFRRDPPPPPGAASTVEADEDPPSQATGEPVREEAPTLRPTLPPATSPGPAITLDSIESLEEEMAKLLGRAAGGDKK